jgi:hypothetical protein
MSWSDTTPMLSAGWVALRARLLEKQPPAKGETAARRAAAVAARGMSAGAEAVSRARAQTPVKSRRNGSDEQMFGAESQVLHGRCSD